VTDLITRRISNQSKGTTRRNGNSLRISKLSIGTNSIVVSIRRTSSQCGHLGCGEHDFTDSVVIIISNESISSIRRDTDVIGIRKSGIAEPSMFPEEDNNPAKVVTSPILQMMMGILKKKKMRVTTSPIIQPLQTAATARNRSHGRHILKGRARELENSS
jgi:hypothetical protein